VDGHVDLNEFAPMSLHGTAAAAAEQGCQMSCVRCRALQPGREDGDPAPPAEVGVGLRSLHLQCTADAAGRGISDHWRQRRLAGL